MARYARLPFLLLLQHSLSKANPLRSLRHPASSNLLQDRSTSKTVFTKTVVTTITTQTQETKTVVTKEKPAEDPEVSRFENDSNSRLPVSEGSTSMAEVVASMRRASPREDVETIQFPSSPAAYNVIQSEQAPHAPDMSLVDLQEKHKITLKEAHEPQHFVKSKAEAPTESKQEDHAADIVKKVDPQKSGDTKTSRWHSLPVLSLLSLSQTEGLTEGSQFAMLPAACRLLFFLVGAVIVVLLACGCASAALVF